MERRAFSEGRWSFVELYLMKRSHDLGLVHFDVSISPVVRELVSLARNRNIADPWH